VHATNEFGIIRESQREILFRALVLDAEVIWINGCAEVPAQVKARPSRTNRGG
jgi:hypothetical protein